MKKNTIIILAIALVSTTMLLTYLATQDTPNDIANLEPQYPITASVERVPNTSAVASNKIKPQPQIHNNITLTKTHSTDTEASKNQLFKNKNERIIQDDNGNYLVEISTPGIQSREWIVSNSPIYFPTEDQLNNGVDGCAAGGYYVELKATLTLIVKTENGNTSYQYICTHNHNSNMYFLEAYDTAQPEMQNSINRLIRD
jgi:hypothetical protein